MLGSYYMKGLTVSILFLHPVYCNLVECIYKMNAHFNEDEQFFNFNINAITSNFYLSCLKILELRAGNVHKARII